MFHDSCPLKDEGGAMKRALVIVSLFLLVGCDQGGQVTPPAPDKTGQDVIPEFRTAELEVTVAPDEKVEETALELRFDTRVPETLVRQCEEGEGCFLDKCKENGDCLSGWCVEHMGEGVCSMLCQEECPPGWTCQQAASGPDLVSVCVSNHTNLCRPCSDGNDCKTPVGAEDVCVDYGEEGSFCGGACSEDQECPWGFTCKEATTVDGVLLTQCVADAGVCPCTGKSVELGLWTPCSVSSDWGVCDGKRVCQEGGLSDCDAPVPVEETCNGLDDDCDDAVDEATERGGDSINLCNDDNGCTKDICSGEEGCTYELLTEGECLDGDACTIGDHCEEGVCVGLPIVCDDDNPCTDDMCDGLGGCLNENNMADCDDGDPCTVADQCEDGECAGTGIPCDCQADEDCVFLEDGDLCNGTLYCTLEEWPYECATEPGTMIECPEPADGPDAVCLKAFCGPETGECSLVPDHEGYACEDGDACTIGDTCVEGVCTAGVPPICKDDNPCTDDSCDSLEGCMFAPNTQPCEDGDVCTTGDTCVDGVCTGAEPLVCDDGNVCNGAESCDSNAGCQPGGPLVCDDGDVCTGIESCDPADGCQLGQPLVCADGNVCTDDSCNPDTGCLFTDNQAQCDDGNECTAGDLCEDGACVYASPTICDDDNLCTTDSCDPDIGCVFNINTAPCDDGDLCTTGDHCDLGSCKSSGQLNCNDNNDCTDDACDPNAGCTFTPNSDQCDDENACTVNDHCFNGTCIFDQMADCDDGSICTKDYCDQNAGCQHDPLESPCDDGDQCTTGDVCVDGQCTGAAPLLCDDGNLCTDDLCEKDTGCQHIPNSLPCTDNDACTSDDVCGGGDCQPGPALDCNDDNVCTDDACQSDKGCVFVFNSLGCDDSDACTQNDGCVDGDCVGGPPPDCDDGNECTADSCDKDQGCVHEPSTPCCGNGVVEQGEECDDGNDVSGDGCENDCTVFTELNVTFTTCGQSGPTGPSQGQCDNAYAGVPGLAGKVSVANGTQSWTVPFSGTYRIEVWGAKGGNNGGKGARMRGDFALVKGTQLKILVGQQGKKAPAEVGSGGGGGSFVAKAGNTPVIIAAGGAGTGHNGANSGYGNIGGKTGESGGPGQHSGAGAGGTNGNGGQAGLTTQGVPNAGGGGGFYTNGGSTGAAKGGAAFVNGGNGGGSIGGFGGGGGSNKFVYGCGSSPHGGSGGGGYSGGGGGGYNCNGAGGGGGSYNKGNSQSNSANSNSGHGKIHFLRL